MAFPVADEKIVDAETALGRRLPDPLRARLSTENGGAVSAAGDEWNLFPVRDASDRKRLARSANDIITETKNAREWTGFPPASIALASNGSGDLLILQPESDDIFRWDHEQGSVRRVTVKWQKM